MIHVEKFEDAGSSNKFKCQTIVYYEPGIREPSSIYRIYLYRFIWITYEKPSPIYAHGFLFVRQKKKNDQKTVIIVV